MYNTKKTYWPFILLFDLIGNVIFFWTKLRGKPETVNKVLFIRLEHIGDMIMATPVFETFKKSNPKCEIHVLCKKLTMPLIKNNPFVDKIMTYDAPWFIRRSPRSNESLSKLIKDLRKEKYDVVFEMHGDPRNNCLAFKTGAYSVGYACRGGGFFLNKIVKYDNKLNMVKQNLRLIKNFCNEFIYKTRIYTNGSSVNSALRLMKKYRLSHKGFIIVNPKSGRIEKDLTNEETAEFINKNKSVVVVITGSKEEIEKNSVFDNFPNVINLTGKTDLLNLAELVKHAKKVIAPDTGIIHIARAVNTPFDALYKTTDRRRWGY